MIGDDAGQPSTDTLPALGASALKAYPHLFPPPGFIQVHRINRFVTLDTAGASVVLETINLVQGYTGWIRAIGLEASSFGPVAAPTTFYTLKRGGVALRDYARITSPMGAPETPRSIFIE